MKILEAEFRKELYKNLTEAGYDKAEAQKIVGVKYHDALKSSLIEKMKAQISNIENDSNEALVLTAEDYNNSLLELEKVKKLIV